MSESEGNQTTDEDKKNEETAPKPPTDHQKASDGSTPAAAAPQKKPSAKTPKEQKSDDKKKEVLKKELEERKTKRKENIGKLSKFEGPKSIPDEVKFERYGYQILRSQEIASGYFSKLYKATKNKEESPICVKLTILDRLPADYAKNLTENALKITRYVGQGGEEKGPICAHFAKVFDIFMCGSKVFVFMEEFQTLSLRTRFKTKDTITEFDAKKWGKQLAEAIDYLELSGIAHRNIRPENIIFNKKYDIKLIGFSMAVVFRNEETQQSIPQTKYSPKTPKEMLRYNHLPPQVIKEDYDPSSVDIWSWALIICQCLHNEIPFDLKSEMSIEDQWNQYSTKFQFSLEFKKLLDKCFVSDANSRVTSHEILRHKWLAEKKKI